MGRKFIIPWWHSIKFRLMAFGILMSILPLATLGYFNVQTTRQNLQNNIAHQMNTGVQRLAADLEALIGTEMATVVSLARIVGPQLLKEEAGFQQKTLYTILKETPSLEDISLVHIDGQELARASKRQVVGNEYRHLEHRTSVEKLKGYENDWSRTFLDEHGQMRLEKAIAIRQMETGRVMGGFVVEMSLRGVMNELTKRTPGQQGRIFVVNPQGQLVGHQDFSHVLSQTDVRPSLAVKDFLLEKTPDSEVRNNTYLAYDGMEVLGVWAPVSGLSWGVIQEVPIKEAFSPVNTLINQLIIVGVGLILLVTSLSIFFGMQFSRSLQTLALGVEEIRKGNLHQSIIIPGQNELSRLGETINRMREELHHRRQQERAVWQAEKLSSLGLLASGVAHEVNNPLGIMLAHAQDLQEILAEEGPQELIASGELDHYLETIIRQTKRCKEVTGGLLNFAGHRQGDGGTIDVQDALEAALELLDFRLRKQGIELELALSPRMPRLSVQRGEPQQVFLNVLTNATDAMPGGGVLRIEGYELEGELVYRIMDQGSGIDQDQLEKIFDPFYTTKEPGKGTGLGLPISYSIMQRLCGRIQISSSPQGTIVWLYFPMSKEGGLCDLIF